MSFNAALPTVEITANDRGAGRVESPLPRPHCWGKVQAQSLMEIESFACPSNQPALQIDLLFLREQMNDCGYG